MSTNNSTAGMPGDEPTAGEIARWEADARAEHDEHAGSIRQGPGGLAEDRSDEPDEGRPEPRDVFAIESGHASTPISDRHVPDIVWAYSQDHAYRVGTSVGPVALACIITAAVASRQGWRVRPKSFDHTWTEAAIIWGGITGETGANKSSAMDGAVGILKDFQKAWMKEDAEAWAEYETEMEIYRSAKRAWIANLHAAKPNPNAPTVCPEEPEKPRMRRLHTNDATVEALISMCADNADGVLVAADELMGWLASFGAYKSSSGGAGKDKNAYISAFGGRSLATDRVGSGNVSCESFSVSILGAIQDDVLRKDVAKYPADGLMARFLFAKAEICEGHNVAPNQVAIDGLQEVLKRLVSTHNGREILFAPDAQHVWDRIHKDRVSAARNKSISTPVREHMNKWDSLHARLALVFELITNPDPQEISLDSAERASRYLREIALPETSRVYDDVMAETQEMVDARAIASHILDQRLGMVLFSEISARVSGLRGKDARIGEAMNLLVEYGWVTPRQTRNRKGQRKPGISRWEVTPAVHGIVWQRGR